MFSTGIIKLRRRLGPFDSLRLFVPPINELLALLCGVKPVLFDTVAPENWDAMRAVCEGLKLHIEPFEDKDLQAERTFILIGRNKRLVKNAARLYADQREGYLEWGTALGYPACCVEALKRWQDGMGEQKDKPDIVEFVLDHTPRGARLPFYTNNVFNYFSRPGRHAGRGYDEKDRRQGDAVSRMNASIAFSLLPIISWHPCSYSCAASVGKGKAVFEMMSRFIPDFAEHRKRVLSKPVFFADKYEFAVLNDISRRMTSGGVRIAYDGLFPLPSLIDGGYLALLKKNSSITRGRDGLKVGSKVLKPAVSGSGRPPLLLPFSSQET